VHDANAWALGGVSGHAGLFSSARDLAVFAAMMLNGGEYRGVRILRPETIARWTARQSVMSSRALGWDTPAPDASSGHYFSPRSFGHTGFTGTSIWLDPDRGLFVVLLMNRVNSRGESQRHTQLRRDVSDAVQSAILDAPLIDWEAALHPSTNRMP
jgi:CubicO group peptidase (beta-lactamase class C family)